MGSCRSVGVLAGGLGWGWFGWYPGSAEDGLAQGIHHVAAVFGGGGEVSADSVAVLGSVLAGEAAGDLLLDLGRSQVAFGLVRGGRHLQIVGEAQHVGLAVPPDGPHRPCFGCSRAVSAGGGGGQSDSSSVPEPPEKCISERLL